MSAADLKRFAVTTAIVALGTLALQVWLIDSWQIGLHTLRRATLAVTATTLFWATYAKWGWKWRLLRLIFERPRIAGTWTGHLESNWVPQNQEGTTTIPIIFVIRQTLLTVTIQSYTQGMEGSSQVANLITQIDSGSVLVSYVYMLRREFTPGSGHQQGAGELRLYGKDELRGAYWTNDGNRGRITLRHIDKKHCTSIKEAQGLLPLSKWATFS
ncbi:hypothetical protein [Actinokineospora diospyrosa]|uniref:CD-NTase-associated protein 15 domain-containing protein n=1 Tax=Actinokineospora diospyrosa TaxID=103728 RepID=A0ABT1IDH4_9PSEU|nr:hypothetical protein [Actinokineospora diospyrosa]MCP2270668.1 hypothetical protein [Actinokineospora diospyrosa]